MNAVICSNLELPEMKESFLKYFEEIQDKNIDSPKYDLHFKPTQTGKLIKMQSIKDETIMEYFWIVENLRPLYKKHADGYICHVIGH